MSDTYTVLENLWDRDFSSERASIGDEILVETNAAKN